MNVAAWIEAEVYYTLKRSVIAYVYKFSCVHTCMMYNTLRVLIKIEINKTKQKLETNYKVLNVYYSCTWPPDEKAVSNKK